MDSSDRLALHTALDWLRAGRRVLLATVVQTWGSSPRPTGAWAAFRDDGLIAGSVSGGCIEDDLAERTRQSGAQLARPEVLRYGVSQDEAARFGLPCGGSVVLVLESAQASTLQALQQQLQSGALVRRELDLCTGQSRLSEGRPDDTLQFEQGRRLCTVHGPRWRLLVIGAGQLTQHLAPMAQALDYAVTVCDPREEYATGWQLPGVQFTREMPDDAVAAWRPDERSAIVAVTHDPKLDDLALIDALRSQAFYVGALGSRANQHKRKARLQEHFDLRPEELARLHGPVGLAIGSRTPAEIAVSILAELTAVKHGVSVPLRDGAADGALVSRLASAGCA